MRISTSQMHERSVNAMLDQQAKLSKTELQLATGRKILAPSDDPTGSSRILELDQTTTAAEQYNRNADQAESRLELEEGVLNSTTDVVQRIRELALQANNDTQTNESRQSIAEEMHQLKEELLDLANTRDSSGEYLFAGNKTDTEPFRVTSSSVVYEGDQGQRQLQIGSSNQVAVGDAGSEIFMAVPEGNGEFVVDTSNSGASIVGNTSVTDSSKLTGHDYTLRFGTNSDGELRYYVNDDTSNTTFNWNNDVDWDDDTQVNDFETGQDIEFDGMSFGVQGEPAAGDEIQITPAGNQSVFQTVDQLIGALESSAYTAEDSATFHNTVNQALANLDQAEGNISNTRAKIGGRLNDIERQRYTNEDQVTQLKTVRSEIADLDYAEATSRYAQQETALKAAQQSYIKIKDLSLFNYL